MAREDARRPEERFRQHALNEADIRAPNEGAVHHCVVVKGRSMGVKQQESPAVRREQVRSDLEVEDTIGEIGVADVDRRSGTGLADERVLFDQPLDVNHPSEGLVTRAIIPL
jgi:hypothetical protein